MRLYYRKLFAVVFTFLLLLFSFPIFFSVTDAAAQNPVIKIVDSATGASEISLGSGSSEMPPEGYPFTVKVVLQGTATNLNTYQVAVRYNASTLNCTGIWINTSDPTFIFRQYRRDAIIPPAQPPFITGGYGYMFLGASLLFRQATVTDGLLCQLNFTTKAQGTSQIEVVPTDMQPADTFLSTGYVADIPFDIGPHFSVTVATSKTPPVASFTIFTQNPKVNQTVQFSAYDSHDPDGAIVSYFWDYGDGSTENLTGITATHNYTIGGSYLVNLTVTDNDGLSGSFARELLIGRPPIVSFTFSPTEIQPLDEVLFNASESHAINGSIVSYFWDFGDDTNETVSTSNVTHVFVTKQAFTVTLTIYDNDGLHNTTSSTVLVGNRPVALFTYSPDMPLQDEVVTFDASLSRIGNPGDPSSYIALMVWDFTNSGLDYVTVNATDINATGSYLNANITSAFIIQYVYPGAGGNYSVNLTVYDNYGLYSSHAEYVYVQATGTSNPGGGDDTTLYAAVAAGVIVAIIAAAVVINRRKKPESVRKERYRVI